MPDTALHRTSHQVEVAAPAGVVYGLIADAVRWPLFFAPTVHVEPLDLEGAEQRLRMWALANGEVKSWVTRRRLDPGARRIEFRQETTAPPVKSMFGTWSIVQLPGGISRLTLLHHFSVDDDHTDDVTSVERACGTNVRVQLANVKHLAERWTVLDELVLTIEDAIRINGPAELVYDFLYRAEDWPERLPNLTRLHLVEDVPGVQMISMDTVTSDGSEHTTRSVRVCFPHGGRIVYKLTETPALIVAHAGEWSVEPDENGVKVTAHHQVVLREQEVAKVLGNGTDLAAARQYVRQSLGHDSTTILQLAKRHAESAVRMLTPRP
ncbi:aromatase/cyclase [Streptomyces sp. ISL-96]|uniref:aromatase/cyclase n=1 Tax=Streptomyces sp. ISL-96 TaxID=2819191 RepID=UPI001BE7829E|nr:aromatase/cyclase [Streptomyces sp. ISL-96]MBT2493447.1 aromatase/cyclase [Streptomyces sp. ISL-96]